MKPLVLMACLVLCGCAVVPERKALEGMWLWPSRTKPFCLPNGKVDREKRGVYAGVRCRF